MKKKMAIVLCMILIVSNSMVVFGGEISAVTDDGETSDIVENAESHDVNATYDKTGVLDTYNVTISWGNMQFKYKPANSSWDPGNHTYGTSGGEGTWETINEGTDNKITIVNHSNQEIKALLNLGDLTSLPGDNVVLGLYKEIEKTNLIISGKRENNTGVKEETNSEDAVLPSAEGKATEGSDLNSLTRTAYVGITKKPSTVFTDGKIASITVEINSNS